MNEKGLGNTIIASIKDLLNLPPVIFWYLKSDRAVDGHASPLY
jgi:hypothetical protein